MCIVRETAQVRVTSHDNQDTVCALIGSFLYSFGYRRILDATRGLVIT